jgi:hypothetical protein
MKLATLIVAALALVLAAAGVTYGLQAHSAERHTQATLATQAREIAAMRRQLATVTVKAAGQHRDLITCGDLNTILNDLPSADPNGDEVFYSGPNGGVPLPAHCLNQ